MTNAHRADTMADRASDRSVRLLYALETERRLFARNSDAATVARGLWA